MKFLLVISFAVFASYGYSASIEAKKDGVKVLKEAKRSATTLMTLKKGEALESISRKGLYWKVKTPKGEGFVSVMKVKRNASSGGGLSKAIRLATKDGRDSGENMANARSRSAVMGVRGLDENDDTAMIGNMKPNLRMVFAMEDRHVSPKKINALGDKILKEVELISRKKGIEP